MYKPFVGFILNFAIFKYIVIQYYYNKNSVLFILMGPHYYCGPIFRFPQIKYVLVFFSFFLLHTFAQCGFSFSCAPVLLPAILPSLPSPSVSSQNRGALVVHPSLPLRGQEGREPDQDRWLDGPLFVFFLCPYLRRVLRVRWAKVIIGDPERRGPKEG